MINKIKSLIKRAVVTNPGDDSKQFPVSQVRYLSKTQDAEMIYPYGFGALAPKDAICIVFNVNAQESNLAGIPTLPQSRIKNLKEGDVFMHNAKTGDSIKLTENGIEIISASSISITAATIATIKAPSIVLDGNVSLGGVGGPAIARVGDSIMAGVIVTGSANHSAT